jgi:hypothetical protein
MSNPEDFFRKGDAMTDPETPTTCASTCASQSGHGRREGAKCDCGFIESTRRVKPETPTVERFMPVSPGVKSPDGEYVRHADYLTLLATCERLRDENARLTADLEAIVLAHDTHVASVRVMRARAEAAESDLARLRADKEQE